jgi:predicted lipid-binding transport protein (Tim44 family)
MPKQSSPKTKNRDINKQPKKIVKSDSSSSSSQSSLRHNSQEEIVRKEDFEPLDITMKNLNNCKQFTQSIIKALIKADQDSMGKDNEASLIKYLTTVHARIKTYDKDCSRFIDYKTKNSKVKTPVRKSKK